MYIYIYTHMYIYQCGAVPQKRWTANLFINCVFLVVVLVVVVWLPPAMPQAALAMVLALA